ncbi:MAG: hypothetical protein R8G66_23635 [Cytophagales bacterium]|nr:hypothetical protein [Cytophagales bacterium]
MATFRLLCLSLLLTSCYSLQVTDGIQVREDIARGSTRLEWDIVYYFPIEPGTPLVKMYQSVVKEIDQDNESFYQFYDLLLFRPGSHELEKEAYLILDDRIVVTLDIDAFHRELSTKIDEETGKALNDDQEEISVVTGYSQITRKNYKVEYNLSQKVMDMVMDAESIQFRYYAGPDMITLPLSGYRLRQLKSLVALDDESIAAENNSRSFFH